MSEEMIKLSVSGMDSREIARITMKNHADVCRDIRGMLGDLAIDQSRFASVYKAGNGEGRRCYVLPKRECLILASGYRVTLRAAIIDRWAELETAMSTMLPKTFAEALRLAADQQERIEAQERQLEAAAPAVAFVGRYVDAHGSQPIRAVAKLLGIPERRFICYLESQKIMYRLSGKLVPVAEHISRGRFEVKTGEENGHAFTQSRFTPEGIEWIASRLRKAA